MPADKETWPTEAMIDAAELKMPDLGRVQIRFLFETMMTAASGGTAVKRHTISGSDAADDDDL